MSNTQTLKAMINERLSATAEEIFALFERAVAEYQREIDRLKNVNESKQMDCAPSSPPSLEVAQPQTDAEGKGNEKNTGVFRCKEETELLMIALQDDSQMRITNVKSLDRGDELQLQKAKSEGPEEQAGGGGGGDGEDSDNSYRPSSEEEEEEDTDSDEPAGSRSTKKPFRCSVCKRSYPQWRTLKMHMKWVHNNNNNDKPNTSTGNTSNSEQLSLSQQDVDFLTGKPFSCPICKREFKFKPTLEDHLRKHTGEGLYSCSICVTPFPDHVDFICHMKSAHAIENPFRCSVCHKSLRNARNYRTHMLIHTGDRPFLCSVCGRGFLQSGNLKYHMLTHTGEKPFSCSECGARYTSKQNLMHHKKTHH